MDRRKKFYNLHRDEMIANARKWAVEHSEYTKQYRREWARRKRASMPKKERVNMWFEKTQQRIALRGETLLSTVHPGKMPWKIQCKFGHVYNRITREIKFGCPSCNSTGGEAVTRYVFEKAFGVPFPRIRPDWLRGPRGGKLEYDGYNEELQLAFEYQGVYHYKQITERGNLEEHKDRDATKRAISQQRGVCLIEVPYWIARSEIGEYVFGKLKENGVVPPNSCPSFDEIKLNAIPERLSRIRSHLQANGWVYNGISNDSGAWVVSATCPQGHAVELAIARVFKSPCCDICTPGRIEYLNKQRDVGYNNLKEVVSRRGYLLSGREDYSSGESQMKVKCFNNHEWVARAEFLRQGQWCRQCEMARRIKAHDDSWRQLLTHLGMKDVCISGSGHTKEYIFGCSVCNKINHITYPLVWQRISRNVSPCSNCAKEAYRKKQLAARPITAKEVGRALTAKLNREWRWQGYGGILNDNDDHSNQSKDARATRGV